MFGCSTAPGSPQGKSELEQQAAQARSMAERNDASLTRLLGQSVGHAVFPSVGKGAVGVGGAYGKGVLIEGRNAVAGYCDLTQASIGLQLGVQDYTEILVFSTREALDRFKGGNFAFSQGVAVFTTDSAGLMFEVAVGGQKFSYEAR
jgi:lipid-binding SYLF domain-containing protein